MNSEFEIVKYSDGNIGVKKTEMRQSNASIKILEKIKESIDVDLLFDSTSISQMRKIFGKNVKLNKYISALGAIDALDQVIPLSQKEKILLMDNENRIKKLIMENVDEIKQKVNPKTLYKYISPYFQKYPEEFNIDAILLLAAYKAISSLKLEELTDEEREEKIKIFLTAKENIKSFNAVITLHSDEENEDFIFSCRSIKETYREFIEKKDDFLIYLVQNDLISKKEYNKILNLFNINQRAFAGLIDIEKVNEGQIKRYLSEQNKIGETLFNCIDEKGILGEEEKLDYYLDNKIHIKTLDKMSEENKSKFAESLSIDTLMKLYKDKENQNKYIRYANLFRTMVLSKKSKEEKDEIGDNIIEALDSEFENEDLIRLYQEHLISLKTVESWGGSNLIKEMMKNAILKPVDVKEICIEDNYASIFEIMKDDEIPRKNKLAIFYTTFADEDDNLTIQQQEMREKAKRECLRYMNFINKSIKIFSDGDKIERGSNDETKIRGKRKEYVSEPLNRWTLVKLLDEEYSYEMLDQGMMIFKLPNLDNGIIILEKMFKKEVPDYARATKIIYMSIEEFEEIKNSLIIEGDIPPAVVDRNPKLKGRFDSLWHTPSWGQKMADLFNYKSDPIRSKENIEKIDREIGRIKRSRRLREE